MHMCTTCGKIGGHGRGICPNRLSVPDRIEQKAAEARAKAERIANEVTTEYATRVRRGLYRPTDFHGQRILPSAVLSLIEDAATAAALAALTEMENAR